MTPDPLRVLRSQTPGRRGNVAVLEQMFEHGDEVHHAGEVVSGATSETNGAGQRSGDAAMQFEFERHGVFRALVFRSGGDLNGLLSAVDAGHVLGATAQLDG
jgi:hypothetical protein